MFVEPFAYGSLSDLGIDLDTTDARVWLYVTAGPGGGVFTGDIFARVIDLGSRRSGPHRHSPARRRRLAARPVAARHGLFDWQAELYGID